MKKLQRKRRKSLSEKRPIFSDNHSRFFIPSVIRREQRKKLSRQFAPNDSLARIWWYFRQCIEYRIMKGLRDDARWMTIDALQNIVSAEYYCVRRRLRFMNQGWLAWQQWNAQKGAS